MWLPSSIFFQSLITSIACQRDCAVSHALARRNLGDAKTDLQCRVRDQHFEPMRPATAAASSASRTGVEWGGSLQTSPTLLALADDVIE
jgi:hypothetical protein